MRWMMLFIGGAMVSVVGCGKYEPAPMPQKPAAPQAAAPAQPAPTPTTPPAAPQSGMTLGMQGIGTAVGMAPLETAVSGPMGVAPARPAAPPPPPAQPTPPPAAVKADSGVGAKGQGYGPGLVTTPVATYFRAQEQIVFRIQIPDAMRLYKATNGHAPKSHEEFMEKIVNENRIRLPELPPGHRYRYYPDREELMVEHPAP